MDPTRAISHLSEIELAAEEVLTDKHTLVTLDKRRQKVREAVRSLQKKSVPDKTWVCFGSMFVKLPTTSAATVLDKDFNQIEQEIQKTRVELKKKMNRLCDLENKEELKGFNLNPISKDEMNQMDSL